MHDQPLSFRWRECTVVLSVSRSAPAEDIQDVAGFRPWRRHLAPFVGNCWCFVFFNSFSPTLSCRSRRLTLIYPRMEETDYWFGLRGTVNSLMSLSFCFFFVFEFSLLKGIVWIVFSIFFSLLSGGLLSLGRGRAQLMLLFVLIIWIVEVMNKLIHWNSVIFIGFDHQLSFALYFGA